MPQTPKIDALETVLRKFQSWCSERKITLIYGTLEDPGPQLVQFQGQTESPDDEYLSLIGGLRASGLVVSVERLSQDRWQSEFDLLQRLPEVLDRDARLRRAEQFRSHIGHIAVLKFHAFVDQPHLILFHDVSATWASELSTWGDEDESIFKEEGIDPSNVKRNDDFGRQLATHSRFPFAKNFAKRRYLAETVFKTEKLSDEDILDIVRRAEIIYDVEIKQ